MKKFCFLILSLLLIDIGSVNAFDTVSSPTCQQNATCLDDGSNQLYHAGYGYLGIGSHTLSFASDSTKRPKYLLKGVGPSGNYDVISVDMDLDYFNNYAKFILLYNRINNTARFLYLDCRGAPYGTCHYLGPSYGIYDVANDFGLSEGQKAWVQNNKVYVDNGSGISFYDIDSASLIGTTSYPTNYVAPDFSQAALYLSVPVTVRQSGYTGSYYEGTDSKAYFLGVNGSSLFLESNVLDGQQLLPLGPFGSNYASQTMIFSNINTSYANILAGINPFGASLHKSIETGTRLYTFNYYSNPFAYFSDGGGVKRWSTACINEGYTSCELFGSDYKCSDGAGGADPANITCDSPVTPPPDTEGGGESSSGSTAPSFPYTGTGSVPGTTCNTTNLTDLSSVTWYTDFGSLTPTGWSGASNVEGGLGWQDTANNGNDTDYFRGIYFAQGSYLPHDVMTGLNSAGTTNVEYLDDRTTPLSVKDPRVRIISKRGGRFRDFNVIQTSGTGSFNGSLEPGATYAEFGRYDNNGVSTFLRQSDGNPCVQQNSATNNTCTTISNTMANFADLHINSGMTGVRIGVSAGSQTAVSCQNDSYACNWVVTGTGKICTGISRGSDGFVQGDCGVTSEGYCAPTDVIRHPTPYEHCTQYNASGSCVAIGPGAYPGAPVDTAGLITDDIFACPQYKDWTDSVQCIIQVFKNAYSVTKRAVNNTTSDSDKTVVGNLKQIGNTGSSVNFGTFSTGGVNLADNIYRGAWAKAFDKNDTLTGFSRAAFFGAVLMLILLIALAIPLFASRFK